jgi:hypothetical protein
MKKVLIGMISLALTGTASAQHFHGGSVYSRPHVIISTGFYPYYGFGFGFNPLFPYYPYARPYNNRPSKLDLQIMDIKNDYKDRIWSVKHDASLTRKERKGKVHELKVERDNEINDLKKNYYKHY